MGRKSRHFRHSLDAHQDVKMIELIDELGLEGVGLFYTVLEVYGTAVSNDDNEEELQKISIRRLASICQMRSDKLICKLNCLKKLKLISHFSQTSSESMFELSIANFFKYYGFYKKTVTKKTPKKRKEKKIKEKESEIEISQADGPKVLGLGEKEHQKKLHSEKKSTSLQSRNKKPKLDSLQNFLSADEIKSEASKFKQCLQGDT